ncbi:MAG TPA: hypothetical protein K8V00_07415 [Ligilactobacillus acidipiscis]|uniref:Uncharacterized protein n=1 Tax=Ligilactobacillus acidipiscis TaxID=89059 RepID=A0A921K1T0_9LACO|nr:hypothetical protein [Ligilactobacillus acidipiscis]
MSFERDHDSQIIIRSEALHGKRRVDIQDKGMDLHYYIKNKNGLTANNLGIKVSYNYIIESRLISGFDGLFTPIK